MNRSILPILGAMALGLPFAASGNDSKLNMIVIMTDDMGYADVGFNGSFLLPLLT